MKGLIEEGQNTCWKGPRNGGKVNLFTAVTSWEIEWGKKKDKKKASEKISRMYEANKQKENTARCKERGFKAERWVFKRNAISISSAKGQR